MNNTTNSFMTVNEVAQLLNVAEKTIRKYVFERSIPYFKIGGHVRFDQQKIIEWIKEREVPTYNEIKNGNRGRK